MRLVKRRNPAAVRLAAALIALLPALTAAAELRYVEVPRLPQGTIELRIAYAVNERLPRMSDRQLETLLATARRTVKRYFGVTIAFTPLRRLGVASLFERIPPAVMRARRASIYDFKHGGGDRAALLASMRQGLAYNERVHKSTLAEMIDFARPYLRAGGGGALDRDRFAEALVDTLLYRLGQWRRLVAADGKPVIDDSPYNEWALWDSIGYGDLSFDVVLTNQLVASAEYFGQDLAAAIRGNVTNGTTTYSKRGRFGAYVWFTTFTVLNDFPPLLELRDGRRYGDEEAARLAGTYLAHEIGHLLFHFGHPFGVEGCVMTPVELLKFHQWVARLDPERCKTGSSPAMTPGAAEIEYHPEW